MMANWLKTVSKNIKRLKDEMDLTQDQLAEKAGCSKSVVRDLEAASPKASASMDMLEKIAIDGLGITLNQLLTEHEVEEKPSESVSKTLLKMMAVPDFVYEKAWLFPKDHDIWKTVRHAFENEEKDLSEKASQKKRS